MSLRPLAGLATASVALAGDPPPAEAIPHMRQTLQPMTPDQMHQGAMCAFQLTGSDQAVIATTGTSTYDHNSEVKINLGGQAVTMPAFSSYPPTFGNANRRLEWSTHMIEGMSQPLQVLRWSVDNHVAYFVATLHCGA